MKVLGRFDRDELERRFAAAGLLDAVARRGYRELRIDVEDEGMALPHVRLVGRRHGPEVMLLDACLAESTVPPEYFATRGFVMTRPVSLLVAYWVREQDPSRSFTPERPPLPLQQHPGLGVLPIAFRVVREMATEIGKDGIGCLPKLYHDAYIFLRSRLFLFLDGREQGRFQRLQADLAAMPLGHASLALLDGHVRDETGDAVLWAPGQQVFPLSERLTAYFHSEEYASQVESGMKETAFSCAALDLSLSAGRLPSCGSEPT